MKHKVNLTIGLIVIFVVGFLWILPMLLNRQYFGLRHKSVAYYTELTRACNFMIATHPLGTNESVKISVTDSSLPKVITDLRPIKINVTHQRFWMLLGSDSHAGFGLAWEPQWDNTNIWVLHTIAEGLDTVIYSSTN
jgi:hypothetical protein